MYSQLIYNSMLVGVKKLGCSAIDLQEWDCTHIVSDTKMQKRSVKQLYPWHSPVGCSYKYTHDCRITYKWHIRAPDWLRDGIVYHTLKISSDWV